jgi:hypothetical protein
MKFFLALALVSTTALVYSLLPAQAQTKDEYPLCQSAHTSVGEVPDRPFTARVEEGLRRIRPDGNSVRANSGKDSPAGLVVRDGSGRVMIASRITTTQRAEGEMREWSETICDPAKGTITTLNYRAVGNSFGSNADVSDGTDAYIPSGAEGTGWSRVQNGHTTVVFAWWHNVVNGRDNLGPETFEGIPAYRYRLTRTRGERSIRDVVNSDQLFLQLAETRWKTYPEIEDEINLTDVHLGEPPQALLDLPSAVHVSATPD